METVLFLFKILTCLVCAWGVFALYRVGKLPDAEKRQRQYSDDDIEFLEALWENHERITIMHHTIPNIGCAKYDVPAGIFGNEKMMLIVDHDCWALFSFSSEEFHDLKLEKLFRYDAMKIQPPVFRSLSWWNNSNVLETNNVR